MTERTPDENAAIRDLVREFYKSINNAGVDRQAALDALEFAMWNMLVHTVDSRGNLDWYLSTMRERCLELWDARNQGEGSREDGDGNDRS
jgi:hypothetical protein